MSYQSVLQESGGIRGNSKDNREQTHTHTHTPIDMHRWQEERQHPLEEYKAGQKGWKLEENKKKKVKEQFFSFCSEEVVTYSISPQHLHSQWLTAGVCICYTERNRGRYETNAKRNRYCR